MLTPTAPSGSSPDSFPAADTPMTMRLFFFAVTSSLAGFLFGFDTVVISGAEKTIQSLWNLSPAMHGIALGGGALRHGARLARRRLAHG